MVEDANLDGTEEHSVTSFLFDSPIEEGSQDELGMKHAAESLATTCLAGEVRPLTISRMGRLRAGMLHS